MFYNSTSRLLFLYQPVNADVYIPYRPYHPEILYLGRHNYLEDLGLPSKPEDNASMYIYALVRDTFGKNVDGKLAYTINNEKPLTEKMTLWSGISTNGIWSGKIPNEKANMPYTVRYSASFKDDLGYSVTYPVNGSRQALSVNDRYILVDSQQYDTGPVKSCQIAVR